MFYVFFKLIVTKNTQILILLCLEHDRMTVCPSVSQNKYDDQTEIYRAPHTYLNCDGVF